ncbi:MAG: hypothetical protein UX13_C0026G0040 [Candidatus Woesebacteria bacterium GW2011_GWB1_45_5]|uniref:Uncharacterized protein n=1 Tax=Candidatus Woesebacteria bacterium GW2011_GWB1_45_5 TaxID=1618581 RepID=A0A0G1MP11_9BACT|nr:MAG: hypothetical protein UX13_C0026G0040 [Candidatus Woesebacteria bacterium GW2011_GWB1_45_5]
MFPIENLGVIFGERFLHDRELTANTAYKEVFRPLIDQNVSLAVGQARLLLGKFNQGRKLEGAQQIFLRDIFYVAGVLKDNRSMLIFGAFAIQELDQLLRSAATDLEKISLEVQINIIKEDLAEINK